MSRVAAGLISVLTAVVCFSVWAADESGLAEALRQHYKLASPRLSVNGDSTIEPGTILVVRKEGIVSFGDKDASYASLCPSEVEDGAVRAPRNPACTTLAPASRRLLKPSERVCLTAIDVAESLDTVSLFLATCNPSDLAHASGTNRAVVVFHFPKRSQAKITASKVEAVIGESLSENGADTPPPPDPVAAQAQLPPPGTAAGGPIVAVGQTVEQVQAALGAPSVIAYSGVNMIYLYPSVKVIFHNGKVSNILQL